MNAEDDRVRRYRQLNRPFEMVDVGILRQVSPLPSQKCALLIVGLLLGMLRLLKRLLSLS